jgi:hypothetical protein
MPRAHVAASTSPAARACSRTPSTIAVNVFRVKPSMNAGAAGIDVDDPRRNRHVSQPRLREQREDLPADQRVAAGAGLERDDAVDRPARVRVVGVEKGRAVVALDDRERTARLTPELRCSDERAARVAERVQHQLADDGAVAERPRNQFYRLLGRVLVGGGRVTPDLPYGRFGAVLHLPPVSPSLPAVQDRFVLVPVVLPSHGGRRFDPDKHTRAVEPAREERALEGGIDPGALVGVAGVEGGTRSICR